MLITLLLSATPLLNPAMCPQEPVPTTHATGWIVQDPATTVTPKRKTSRQAASSLIRQAQKKHRQANIAKQAKIRQHAQKAQKAHQKSKAQHAAKRGHQLKNKATKHTKTAKSTQRVQTTKATKTIKAKHHLTKKAKAKHNQAQWADSKKAKAKSNRVHKRALQNQHTAKKQSPNKAKRHKRR